MFGTSPPGFDLSGAPRWDMRQTTTNFHVMWVGAFSGRDRRVCKTAWVGGGRGGGGVGGRT